MVFFRAHLRCSLFFVFVFVFVVVVVVDCNIFFLASSDPLPMQSDPILDPFRVLILSDPISFSILSYPIPILSYPIPILSYPIPILSYPIPILSYPI